MQLQNQVQKPRLFSRLCAGIPQESDRKTGRVAKKHHPQVLSRFRFATDALRYLDASRPLGMGSERREDGS